MKFTAQQTAALATLAAALANPTQESKQIEGYDGKKRSFIRVTGINGNAINSLYKLGAISLSSHLGAKNGGHWLADLKINA